MKKILFFTMLSSYMMAMTACGGNNSDSETEDYDMVDEEVVVSEVPDDFEVDLNIDDATDVVTSMSSSMPVAVVEEDDDSYNDSSSASSSSANSENWDSVLDSYEKYTDKYISLMKKAVAGDISAMAEYPSMLEEATNLQNKLENAGSMSASQAARFSRIQQKLMNAAQSLY